MYSKTCFDVLVRGGIRKGTAMAQHYDSGFFLHSVTFHKQKLMIRY
jgi:hypothetical protein